MARRRAALAMFRCAVVIGFAIWFLPVAQAQISNVTDTEATPIPGAGHHYLGGLNETVNPANGSLSIRIDAQVPEGRKLTLPFSIAYDSNGALPIQVAATVKPYVFAVGWTYSAPMLTTQRSVLRGSNGNCALYSSYIFYDAQGTRHALNIVSIDSQTTNECSLMGYTDSLSGGDPVVSARAVTSDGPVTVQDADGTTYFFPAGLQGPPGASSLVSSVEDRNGNLVQYVNNGQGVFTVTDTAGRSVVSSNGFGATGDTVAVSGLATPYSLTWGTTATWNYNTGETLVYQPSNSSCNGLPIVLSPSGSLTALSVLTLPNGQSYKFYYDSTYGVVNEIVYPTGAWVKYTWSLNALSEVAAGPAVLRQGAGNCYYHYGNPAITKRQVSYDGTTIAEEQDFAYSTTWSGNTGTFQATQWSTKNTTVTTYDKVRNINAQTAYTYTPIGIPVPPDTPGYVMGTQVPVESTIIYHNWDTNVLRTINKTWLNQFLLKSEQTVLPPTNLASQINYSYGSLGVVTEKDEYDWGQSTPTRKTVTQYQSFPLNALNSALYDRPCQILVEDGSGNRFAETDYFYDNGGTTITCGTAGTPSVTGVSNLTEHDETNFGPSTTKPRGNATTIVKQCFQGSTSCPQGNSTSTFAFDETGQVVSMTDPCGQPGVTCTDIGGTNHTTTYNYSDSYSSGTPPGDTNAFLTKITYPTPIDGAAQIRKFAYSYADGQLTSSTDENNQPTYYKYNTPPSTCSYSDGLDRLSEIDYPDQGKTTNCYNDAGPSPTVTTIKLITATPQVSFSATTVMDGLGHTTQTQLTSDPEGTTYTAATYDGLGSTYQSWSPTRCSPPTTNCGTESTWGITTHAHDALGRATTLTDADGSTVSTAYSNNCTTVTDEAGKARESCLDGLGRLTSAFEDPGSAPHLNYETDYTFNELDDLLTVNQKGGSTNSSQWRPRTFTYDSLSQLITANNPESGSITYVHDADGNITYKTSPAPNQTGTATVTLSFCYDALKRLTAKGYTQQTCNNGTLPSPAATYLYDQTSYNGLTITNGISHRTGMTDAAGAEAWSYDVIGRVLTDRRTTNSVTVNTSESYNLDGSIATLVYPSGRTITYTSSAAARTLAAQDVANGINYVTNATYAPQGAVSGLQNGTSIFGRLTYNSRLQPLQLFYTTGTIPPLTQLQQSTCPSTVGTIMHRAYNFGYGTNDNGNVVSIGNCRDTNRTQNFIYDSLNRIQQAYTSGPNWGETFSPNQTAPGVAPTVPGIDAWGNLTNRSPVTGKTLYEGLSCSASTINQLLGCSVNYDAAGNTTSKGSASYGYDNENRVTTTSGWTYVYDGDGKRVQKGSGTSGTLYWTGADSNPLSESSLNGTMQEEYIFFDGERIARRDISTNAVHYYFSDHLLSADVVTSNTGGIQEESDYYPYGGEIVVTSGDPNRYKFTGKERDAESGLDMFGARYYGSSLGRFMTPDWSSSPEPVPYADLDNPQTLNLYSYVKNNPTTLTDADGHCDVDGEHHNWVWCAAHAIGITETKKEQQAELHQAAENMRRWWADNGVRVFQHGKQVNPNNMSDQQVLGASSWYWQAYFSSDDGEVNTYTGAVAGAIVNTASQIASGHGWAKHQGEFPGWDQGKYEDTVRETMQQPDEVRTL